MTPARLTEALTRALPRDAVVIDPDVLEAYRRDQAALVGAGVPAVVVRPSDTAEVQAVMQVATELRAPVVTRGAGSGLSGGANAVDGCVVLSTARMNRILSIDPVGRQAVVQPGVVNQELKDAARAAGLAYLPDPASAGFSTLGGNVATNAGGLCCVKYGVTGDSVLALEVVLADGAAIRVGRRTRKGVAGLDLTRLFVGSEGALGVITEMTLALRAQPSQPATLVASFDEVARAGAAVAAIVRSTVPSLLEIMDRTTIRAVDDWKPVDLDRDAAALVMAQSDAGGDRGAEEIGAMARACEEAGATLVVRSEDPADAEPLLAARRLAFPALERLGDVLLDDVAVPVAAIPDLLRSVEEIARARGVTIGTFGHAGDGNMHPTIVFDRSSRESEEAARAAFDDIVGRALDLGGTITGEHGVGVLKLAYLDREMGPARAVQRAIKRALDPLGILNPGKAV